MITEKTILVLGAGASKPYGFPTGRELLFEIAQDCQENSRLFDLLIKFGTNHTDISEFGSRLQNSSQPSVDAFLTTGANDKFLEIGKISIAASLLDKEKRKMLIPNLEDPKNGRWYRILFEALGTNLSQYKESRENLSVITFNYDRSLESFLYIAMVNSHNFSEDVYKLLIHNLPILHYYGSLGYLPIWVPTGIAYGADPNFPGFVEQTKEAKKNIHLLNEDIEFTRRIRKRAQDLISSATKICFLGFGYHPENIQNLFGDLNLAGKTIYGTTRGIAANRIDQTNNTLRNQYRCGSVYLDNNGADCEKLLYLENIL